MNSLSKSPAGRWMQRGRLCAHATMGPSPCAHNLSRWLFRGPAQFSSPGHFLLRLREGAQVRANILLCILAKNFQIEGRESIEK
jgi:hypothetical protein